MFASFARLLRWGVIASLFIACPPQLPLEPDVLDGPAAGDPQLLTLPQRKPRLGAGGPWVPGTPGLRVPIGYFTRVRIDVIDFFLPFTLGSFLRGEGEAVFRLESVSGMRDGVREFPIFRAVIPITLPPGSDIGSLTELTLGAETLTRSTATLRFDKSRQYLVEVQRLTFEVLEEGAIKGTLHGRARGGAKSRNYREIRIGFLALRSPDLGMAPEQSPQPQPATPDTE